MSTITSDVHVRPNGDTYRGPERVAAVIAVLGPGDRYTLTETSHIHHKVTHRDNDGSRAFGPHESREPDKASVLTACM